jgi:hypothetical protein
MSDWTVWTATLPGLALAGFIAYLTLDQLSGDGPGQGRRVRADRARQAVALNEEVLQGLVVARMALDLEHPVGVAEALDSSIVATQRMIETLMDAPPPADPAPVRPRDSWTSLGYITPTAEAPQ